MGTEFTKKTFGVKQHEGKSYLFGPGIIDHIGPDKGFGQMGMGDYDQRLQSYCYMFVEKVGEDALRKMGDNIDKERLCKKECATSMSGASDPEDLGRRKRRTQELQRARAEKEKLAEIESKKLA